MGLGRGAHRRGEAGTTYVLCSRLSLSLAHMCYVFATSIYSVQGYVRTRARERGGREGGGRFHCFFFHTKENDFDCRTHSCPDDDPAFSRSCSSTFCQTSLFARFWSLFAADLRLAFQLGWLLFGAAARRPHREVKNGDYIVENRFVFDCFLSHKFFMGRGRVAASRAHSVKGSGLI